MLDTARIDCPYCGEPLDIEVDCSAGGQQYVEDCTVCCQPILVTSNCDSDGTLLGLRVQRENE